MLSHAPAHHTDRFTLAPHTLIKPCQEWIIMRQEVEIRASDKEKHKGILKSTYPFCWCICSNVNWVDTGQRNQYDPARIQHCNQVIQTHTHIYSVQQNAQSSLSV